MAGCCEHGNEPSGCIKCWEFIGWLRDYYYYYYYFMSDSAAETRWFVGRSVGWLVGCGEPGPHPRNCTYCSEVVS